MNQKDWNAFVKEYGPRSGRFLQSWDWGAFQKKLGSHVVREPFEKDGELIGVAQWVKRKIALLGEYRYCPRGPIGQIESLRSNFFSRIEPATKDQIPQGAHKTHNIQPANTLLLDLRQSEDELLASMHHKTRYNIGLAVRRGVHVSFAEHELDDVWALFESTRSRGGFRLHEREYYEKMLATLTGECRAFLATAFYEHQPIATTLMLDFGNTRTYLHGASKREHRNLMAPYLLHWELIRAAKAKGLKWYDWWGVAPVGAKNHDWEGISRFKRGFGGEEVAYPGTYDVVGNPLAYSLYKILRQIHRST
jgi:peptidoglycan pentaglycine glycine transferase (the first glycine)